MHSDAISFFHKLKSKMLKHIIHYVADTVKALAIFSMKKDSGICEQIICLVTNHIS